MYLHDSQVVYPPPGGWPSIVNADRGVLEPLGKSDEVLALLANLPYIRSPGDWTSDADAAPMCLFADWPALVEMIASDPTAAEFVRDRTEGSLAKVAPPHVVGIASGSYDNPVMVLDTKLGIIHWEECPHTVEGAYCETSIPYEPEDEDDDEEEEGDGNEEEGDDNEEEGDDNEEEGDGNEVNEEEVEWREEAMAWSIPQFFENLKDRFLTLHWVPISPRSARSHESLGLEKEEVLALLRDLYRQHGWPDLAVYNKSECLQAVDRALAESYPDDVCVRERD